MEVISILGVIGALSFIVISSMKGINILISSPLATLIIIFTNNMKLTDTLIFNEFSFMNGLASFFSDYFLIFMLGSILAKIIDESGAALVISERILSHTGTENPYSVLLAIFLISTILTYGGVCLFVVLFIVIPLARSLFEKANIPWNLVITPYFLGVATATMTMLPGTPSIQNIIPTHVLGTTLTAAPLMGITASIVVTSWGLWVMKRQLNRALHNNESFDSAYSQKKTYLQKNPPSFIKSSSPLLILVVIILIGSVFNVQNIIYIALLSTIFLGVCLLYPQLSQLKSIINSGAIDAVLPTIYTAATVGFGIVVTDSMGFQLILKTLLTISDNSLFNFSLLTGLMASITGSSSGALGIVMSKFIDVYVESGIQPDVLHRLGTISSGTFTVVPQCGALLSMLAVSGLTHKNSYKYVFTSVVIGSFIAFIVAFMMANYFY